MWKSIGLAAAILSSGGIAHAAATLFVGPASAFANGSVRCFVLNTSTKPIDITVDLFSYFGTQVEEMTCAGVAPAGTCYADTPVANTCKVTSSGASKSVRATLELNDYTNNRTVVVTAP